jgi:hypothetical protein
MLELSSIRAWACLLVAIAADDEYLLSRFTASAPVAYGKY